MDFRALPLAILIWEVIGIHRHLYLSELLNSIFNKVVLTKRFGNLWATLDIEICVISYV